MDGGSQLARVEAVDRRAECRHHEVSRRAAGARRAEGAHHGALQLPARLGAAISGAPLVLLAQHRFAAPVGVLRAARSEWPRTDTARSESIVTGRLDRALGFRAVARRQALRLRPVGRRIRLGHLLRARSRGRQAAGRRDQMGQVQQRGVDGGRPRVLLRALSRTAGGQESGGGAARSQGVLPRARHAAIGRPLDLRTPGRSGTVPVGGTRRNRPLSVDRHQQGDRSEESALRQRPGPSAFAPHRCANPPALSGCRRAVRPARRRQRGDVSANGQGRAQPQDRCGSNRSPRRRQLEDGRAREQKRHRGRRADRREGRRQSARRCRQRGRAAEPRWIACGNDSDARARRDQRSDRSIRSA